MTDDQRRILIAGGGPVGLLCAWLIGRHGLPVRVFDNNSTLQMDLRAATTHPATLDLLDNALVGDMARVGLVAPIFQFWDRPSQKLVAQFDHTVLKNDTRHPFVVQCEQFKTAKLVLDRLQLHPNVEVLFDHEVIDVAQSADAASVQVRGPSGVISRHSGAYLIGADGGRSTVRRVPKSNSKVSPGRSASSSSPRRSISKASVAIATAAISPIPARGAIASRSRPTAHRGFGARSIRPTPRRARTTY
jgi:2-polyprenyl-6-methoxyphenol hydroxylase-like FAD-dependent oxidoreductase